MNLLSSVVKHGTTMSLDELLLFSYLLNCLGDWQCDVSAFKKITAAENLESAAISHIWLSRLSALRPKLQTAAIKWTGVGDTISSLEEIR